MKTLIAAIFLLLTSLAAQAQTVTVNSLTATPAAVQPGQTIVFAATMTANQNYSNYPVEFSVMPPGASPGTNTDQIVFFVSFPAGKPVTQTYNWTVPAGLAPGTYKAELAVFNSHWSAVLALKDIAFTVSAAGGTPAPVASSVPAITGTAQVNATLTASTGTWTGATSYAYSWARNGTPIAGAAGATYTPAAPDVGYPLTVTVTATGPGGTASATSAPTVPVAAAAVAAPVNLQLPVISGTAQVNATLTTSTGTWTGATSYAYLWARHGTPIAQATAAKYTPAAPDVGYPLTATVTATGPGGAASATSAPTVPIVAGGTGGGSHSFIALHTYFMAPNGNDASAGTSTATAWQTPNHPLQCGDVIIAAPGNYPRLQTWGAVSNCPSTTGGIDGTGGVNFATVLCAGNVGACTIINPPGGLTYGVWVDNSNWAVEGWAVSQGYNAGNSGFAYVIDGTGSTNVHHVAFINDIAYNNASAVFSQDNGQSGVAGSDYWAVIGMIAQNSAGRNDGYYDAAIDVIGIANHDTAPGTHIFVSQNFAINNLQTTGGNSDGEGMMIDTIDFHGYSQQIVFKNNINYITDRFGLQVFYQGYSQNAANIKIYNNTFFDSSAGTNTAGCGNQGDINIQSTGPRLPWLISIFNNIAKENVARMGGSSCNVYALMKGGNYAGTVIGGSGIENVFNGLATSCPASCNSPRDDVVSYGGGYGTNIYVNPVFKNTADLLANHTGVPNCNGFTNTVACMGWNYASQTATPLSVIDDLTPTASGVTGKGYQLPSSCAPDADYPTWLKGVVYLKASGFADGATITESEGLMTKPCGM